MSQARPTSPATARREYLTSSPRDEVILPPHHQPAASSNGSGAGRSASRTTAVRGRVTVNSARGLYRLYCLAGLGLIQIPAYDVKRHLDARRARRGDATSPRSADADDPALSASPAFVAAVAGVRGLADGAVEGEAARRGLSGFPVRLLRDGRAEGTARHRPRLPARVAAAVLALAGSTLGWKNKRGATETSPEGHSEECQERIEIIELHLSCLHSACTDLARCLGPVQCVRWTRYGPIHYSVQYKH